MSDDRTTCNQLELREHDGQDDEPELQQHDRQVVRPPLVLTPETRPVLEIVSLVLQLLSIILKDRMAQDDSRSLYHGSAVTGEDWINDLLAGEPHRIRTAFGVNRGTFVLLVKAMQKLDLPPSHVTIEEQVAIFLYTAVTGLPCVHVADRFQHTPKTINKCFKQILQALVSPPFYNAVVQFPDTNSPTPPEIRNSEMFYPFFVDALGAVDCTHICLTSSDVDREAFRNRNGMVTQKCLAACSFDLCFTYVVSGWEGSVDDSEVYDASRRDFAIPEGKYYLADTGFPSSEVLLVPYRGVQYHLAEWNRAKEPPRNPKELFNFRHASARNAIKRTIGIIRRRFRILDLPPDHYDMHTQAMIPAGLAALHNFIRQYDPTEIQMYDNDDDNDDDDDDDDDDDELLDLQMPHPETPNERRDRIAGELWEQYQRSCGT